MPFSRERLPDLVYLANKLVGISRTLISNPEQHRAGGYLAIGFNNIRDREVVPIGDFPADKADKYLRFCQEKMYRLYADWLRTNGEAVSSWQTRQPNMDRWGGAVLFPPVKEKGHIISFSGLTEHCDESLSLILGYFAELTLSPLLAENVKRISENPVIEEMWKAYFERDFPKR